MSILRKSRSLREQALELANALRSLFARGLVRCPGWRRVEFLEMTVTEAGLFGAQALVVPTDVSEPASVRPCSPRRRRHLAGSTSCLTTRNHRTAHAPGRSHL